MDRLFHHIAIAEGPDERDKLLRDLMRRRGPVVVSFINAHGANLAWSDPEFRDALLAADLLLRDGIGMAIAMPWLGLAPGLNLEGTDLIPEILRTYAHRRIALAGST
ncbi:MAG: hypothetical protein WCA30_06040, partial [Dermatophilaceae bacterium]